jgi:MFS family permease
MQGGQADALTDAYRNPQWVAFSQLPGGALTDRVGPRRLLGLGLFVWSLAQAAAGLVGSFWQFVVARVFLGAGEAPMFFQIDTTLNRQNPVQNHAVTGRRSGLNRTAVVSGIGFSSHKPQRNA